MLKQIATGVCVWWCASKTVLANKLRWLEYSKNVCRNICKECNGGGLETRVVRLNGVVSNPSRQNGGQGRTDPINCFGLFVSCHASHSGRLSPVACLQQFYLGNHLEVEEYRGACGFSTAPTP